MRDATDRTSEPAPLAVRWIPSLAALLVFSQVCLLGLRPALAESRRLRAAEERMSARHLAALEERVDLERVLRAQQDPIYLEREARHLRNPNYASHR